MLKLPCHVPPRSCANTVVLARQSRPRSASFRDLICAPLDLYGAESRAPDHVGWTNDHKDGFRCILFKESGGKRFAQPFPRAARIMMHRLRVCKIGPT